MLPPHNLEAEKAIIGSCFNGNVDEIVSSLDAEDFYKSEHAELFAIIKQLYEQNKKIDLITVNEYIQKNKPNVTILEAAQIIKEFSYNIPQHLEIIKENSYLRKVIIISREYQAKALQKDYENIEQFKDELEQKIFNLTKEKTGEIVTVGNILLDHIDRIAERKNKKGITGLTTTIKSLDIMTAGLQKSNLIILAARPSMGKTAFALQIARKNAKDKTVLIFSLEMSKEQIAERMLVQESRVDGQAIRIGAIDEKMVEITNAAEKLYQCKLFVDDTPGPTVSYMRSKARRIKTKHDLGLIVIDYLQLMQTRGINRNLEIGEITRQLKIMARELDVPVVLLSQLNRAVEQRANKKPTLSDLRESGNIEQDADLILFLYRDDYYDQKSEKRNIAEIIIGKQREGPTGTIEALFKKEYMNFYDLDQVHKFQKLPIEVFGGV